MTFCVCSFGFWFWNRGSYSLERPWSPEELSAGLTRSPCFYLPTPTYWMNLLCPARICLTIFCTVFFLLPRVCALSDIATWPTGLLKCQICCLPNNWKLSFLATPGQPLTSGNLRMNPKSQFNVHSINKARLLKAFPKPKWTHETWGKSMLC